MEDPTITTLKAERDEWRDNYERARQRHANVSHLFDESEKALDVAQARVVKLEADASTVAHLRKVLDRVRQRPQSEDSLTDSEVAGMVRMLTRDDLAHEIICVMARDRIIALADAVESLRRERDAAREAFDAVQAGCGFGYPSWAEGQTPMNNAATILEHVRILVAERDAAIEAGKALKAELQVRAVEYVPVTGEVHNPRTRAAFTCGFERAWRGEKFHWTYNDSSADYRTAERNGFREGEAAVKSAIDAAMQVAQSAKNDAGFNASEAQSA